MSPLFPRPEILQQAFESPYSQGLRKSKSQRSAPTPLEARLELYPAYSIVDDTKNKAKKLSAEAAKEFDAASQKAQAKTGHIELYSGKYYAACTFGGLLACGLTHTAVTPLDLVKTRRQVDSKLYKGNFQAWGHIYRAEGVRGIFTGWSPTFFGYSVQGAFKYGWYEYFKKTYSDLAGPDNAHKYKTALYLSASASAEFLADIALCPFEAIKVRMQGTIPSAYTGTLHGLRTITAAEGVSGLYKGLYPLWGRQIPYTMMKFASFETIVEMIYARLPGGKNDYSKAAQTGVSFVGGYAAGILCAIVSHPADVMVSKLNTYRKAGEGFGAVTSRIYSDIGFKGLWNGLPVRIFMIGTLTGLQWMIYDYFKIFMGLPTTGGAAPPAKKELTNHT
ncbi:putative phosphate carrier protein [Podospora australis]|uniref:Phosphate carrier protein n=1 Tax=Podospora australis TaxID=1536484 RepID=A0AAN6X2S6_9PEZI|nr:putative phosphate carrier protein [Podospora australis]